MILLQIFPRDSRSVIRWFDWKHKNSAIFIRKRSKWEIKFRCCVLSRIWFVNISWNRNVIFVHTTITVYMRVNCIVLCRIRIKCIIKFWINAQYEISQFRYSQRHSWILVIHTMPFSENYCLQIYYIRIITVGSLSADGLKAIEFYLKSCEGYRLVVGLNGININIKSMIKTESQNFCWHKELCGRFVCVYVSCQVNSTYIFCFVWHKT